MHVNEPIDPPAPGLRTLAFSDGELEGEVNAAIELVEPAAAAARRLIDPTSAVDTIHWGRNYLYSAWLETASGPIEVVVKQLRNQGLKARLRRRLRGSKAACSWRVAGALVAAGIRTPEPIMLVESSEPEGSSYFITRRLCGSHEVRHFFRRLARAGVLAPADAADGGSRATDAVEELPEVEPARVLGALGGLARRLHDAGIWYRDLSMGNVLVGIDDEGGLLLDVVDYNRARTGRRLGVVRRCRDICRFPVLEPADRDAFLRGYWGEAPGSWSIRSWLWIASVRGYLAKHAIKNRLRRRRRSGTTPGRGRHAHIPAASSGASARNRIVWDRLSDQPHQHAGSMNKLAIRLADGGSHLHDLSIVVSALPRVWARYKQLKRGLYGQPIRFSGMGVALRPHDVGIECQVEALADLGVGPVMIRLHPWEHDHHAAEGLARSLAAAGHEVSFAVPQNRDLVRDPRLWSEAVQELAERFVPFGRCFQVGQAVNRSKWGIWNRNEYIELFLSASEILRRHPGVTLLGPAVIDFEHHMTMAIVNRQVPSLHFDAVSSLLYVDRRGAPENRQIGFDTVDKVTLLKAIAETGRSCGPACWVTEVNWPLWEGPHSPAGRKVSVDEESQADYLVRYLLLALGTGLLERVLWWRLIARGYGLIVVSGDGTLRRRPAFTAYKTLVSLLDGASFNGPLPASQGCYLYGFERDGEQILSAWSLEQGRTVELPSRPAAVIDRDGAELPRPDGSLLEVGPSPRYVRL